MSEAYWLGGFHHDLQLPSDVDRQLLRTYRLDLLSGLMASVGLTPARLNRLDWFTGRMNSLYQREVFSPDGSKTPLSFLWPALPLFSHTILQKVCASLVLEEIALSALVEKNQEFAEAVLVGSPAAVGKYNLVPHVRFTGHLDAAWEEAPLMDPFDAVGAFLKKMEAEPEAVACLALSGPFQLDALQKPEIWKEASWSSAPAENGILQPLNNLVDQLSKTKSTFGLLVSLSADHRALFSLVERI